MTDWFRSWHGAPTDSKWLGIARKAGVATGIAVAVGWALMDRASQASTRGSIDGYDADGLAYFFGCEPDQVDAIVSAMTDKGMIAKGRFSKWEDRQPKREDGAAERAKAWRERNRTHSIETEHKQSLDTDTEEDTEKKEKKDSVANATAADAASEAVVRLEPEKPVYTDSKHELWGEGVPILVSLGLTDRAARTNIGRWLRDVSDDAQQVLGAIQRARDNRIMDAIPWITRALNTGHGNGQNRQNGGRINPFKATLDGLERGFELEASGNDEACPPPPRLLSDGRRQ
jgi:hypothetical protein